MTARSELLRPSIRRTDDAFMLKPAACCSLPFLRKLPSTSSCIVASRSGELMSILQLYLELGPLPNTE